MHCPSCRQPLRENAPACPHCGFSLAVAEQALGIPPRLNPALTDLAGVLSQRDQKRVCKALQQIGATFPQLSFACVVVRLPAQTALPLCAFWLFNRGGLVTPMEKGGRCRLLLLALDVEQGRAACMIGYGLEPFLNDDVLHRIASAALPALREHEYAEAALRSLAKAESELATIADAIPRGFGLHENGASSIGDADEAFAY